MSSGYNYRDRDGYGGGYPEQGRYGRGDQYEMSKGQGYDDRHGERRGGGANDNQGYYPDEEMRAVNRNGRQENFDDIDISKPKKGKKKGKNEYNPSHKGPIKNRSCTDVICCILFLVFIAGLVVVAYFSYANGDPTALIYPQNSNGETCGFGNQKGKPNLFFFDLIQCARVGPGVVVNGCPTPQICVTQCPTENYVFLESAFGDRSKMICMDGVDPVKSTKSVDQLITDNECAPYYIISSEVLNRCLPNVSLITDKIVSATQITDSAGNVQNLTGRGGRFNTTELTTAETVFNAFLDAKEFGEKVITDLQTAWWMILVALGLACLISLIWIVLMRWITGIMVWVSVVAFVLLFAGGAAYSIYMYFDTRGTEESYTFHLMVIQLEFEKEKLFLGLGIVAGIIFLIVFLVFLFLIQRIRIAIALIEEGSRAVGSMVFTLLWPIIPFIFQVLIFGMWGSMSVYLASVGRTHQLITPINATLANGSIDKVNYPNLLGGLCDDSVNSSLADFCTEIRYFGDNYTIYLHIYNIFMLFWLVNFVIAFGQMTLAGAFASYYWAWNKKKDIPTFPVLSSMWRSFRYHLGTLAFGSLIITIIQMIRLALEYVDSKLKGTENPVGKFFIKCLKCCFWCLEKFIKFLNKNAYIMTAVYGKNFCSAARKAFMLILANVVRVVVIDKVTDFVLFIARMVVLGAVAVASYFFFDGRIEFLSAYTPKLNFYLVPIIVIIFATYVIAKVFFSVYAMAVDTLFMCFLMDLDKNDGSTEKPYFMTKRLKKILGKKNKPPPEEEDPPRETRSKK